MWSAILSAPAPPKVARAKAQGKAMGRPPSLTPEQKKEAIRRRAQGDTLAELARSYNVSRATISRLIAA